MTHNREYYLANKEKLIARQTKYYEANKETILEKARVKNWESKGLVAPAKLTADQKLAQAEASKTRQRTARNAQKRRAAARQRQAKADFKATLHTVVISKSRKCIAVFRATLHTVVSPINYRNISAQARARQRQKNKEKYAVIRANPELTAKRLADRREYRKEKMKDPLHRLSQKLRQNCKKAIRRGLATKTAVTNAYLGCTIPEALAHIENLFKPGMTWDNWAIDGWHLDHIKPLAAFDKTDPKWVFEACHYTNLQPLWADENIAKGAQWVNN